MKPLDSLAFTRASVKIRSQIEHKITFLQEYQMKFFVLVYNKIL